MEIQDGRDNTQKTSEISSDNSSNREYERPSRVGWLLSSLFYIKLSIWFLGYSVISGASPILIPTQIAIIHPERKEYWNGVIPIAGMFMNLISTPLFGYLSDKIYTPFGKRRPFLLLGSVIMIVFLAISATFDKEGDSIGGFTVVLMAYNFGQGIAGGAFSGIIPDIVNPKQAGIASGWLGVSWSIGMLVGSLAIGQAISTYGTNFWVPYGILIGILAFTTILALTTLWEDQYDEWIFNFSLIEFFKSLHLPKDTYYDFYWVLITRFFNTMGVSMILNFLLYFTSFILGRLAPIETSLVLAVIILFSIPASVLGGYMADYFNTKLLVYISSSIQVISIALLISICYVPNFAGLLIISAFLGIGYGCYQCVDWALALHSLPNKTIGKDMGIWHLSFIAPTVIAPFITANILDKMGPTLPQSYAVVFGVATIWFILATIFIFPMKVNSNPRRHRQAQERVLSEEEKANKLKELNGANTNGQTTTASINNQNGDSTV